MCTARSDFWISPWSEICSSHLIQCCKISLKHCLQAGELDFKLLEDPGQTDYSRTTQMMKGLENVVKNHVRFKKMLGFFSLVEKTSERGTTLLFKIHKG